MMMSMMSGFIINYVKFVGYGFLMPTWIIMEDCRRCYDVSILAIAFFKLSTNQNNIKERHKATMIMTVVKVVVSITTLILNRITVITR